VITMKLNLGDRVAAGTIAPLDDFTPVVVLTQRGKFKVVKFRAAPHGPRNSKGDLVGMQLVKSDKVSAVWQIVQRPTPRLLTDAEPEPATPSANGANGSK
jgi:hypothetical protein